MKKTLLILKNKRALDLCRRCSRERKWREEGRMSPGQTKILNHFESKELYDSTEEGGETKEGSKIEDPYSRTGQTMVV